MNEMYCNAKRVETLKKRTKHCCCKYCGGQLVLRRIVFSDFEDARIEIFCAQCDRIEYGIEKEIYNSSQDFIDNLQVNFFEELDDNEQRHHMNIARVCEIMAWGLRELGFMTEQGFNVAVNMTNQLQKACMVIADNEVQLEEAYDDDRYH